MSLVTTCPHCSARLPASEQITDTTLICPHCHSPVDNPRSGFRLRAADINTNVKRNLSVGSIILLVLIGLCVLGIAAVLVNKWRNKWTGYDKIGYAFLLMWLFAALDVLVGIAIIRWLYLSGFSGVRVSTVGGILGVIFLSLGLIVTVVTFFGFTCFYLAN